MGTFNRCLLMIRNNRIQKIVGSFNQRRNEGTNFNVWNPSANIREKRERGKKLLWKVISVISAADPGIIDSMTRDVLRPRLPESILPAYALPAKECPPWPYQEKGYRWHHRYLDNTLKRFDENTRIFVVEGNLGTSCDAFAEELAQRLDFHFIREPRIEHIMVDRYGVDKRDYYHLLPEKFCFFDSEMFFAAPDHPMVNMRALVIYMLKFEAYMNALAHLMNTGQGVVMSRHVFNDVSFVAAMHEKKYVSDFFGHLYPRLRSGSLNEDCFELRPHLVIYLDCPPSVCLEKIKKRNRPFECDSKAIDYEYLCSIEHHTKRYLKKAAGDSAIMTIDWTEKADMDTIIDEIYKIDFSYDWNIDSRFAEWNTVAWDLQWNEIRHTVTTKVELMQYFEQSFVDVPEFVIHSDELMQARYFSQKVLGKYAIGYNVNKGDSLVNIMKDRSRTLVPGNWQEYLTREYIWVFPYETYAHFQDPYEPNIPEEEFQPRRFDPQCLKNWNAHH